MCEPESPEWGVCIVSENFMEYLLYFMGFSGMVVPGGATIAEHSEGMFRGNLCEVISCLKVNRDGVVMCGSCRR